MTFISSATPTSTLSRHSSSNNQLTEQDLVNRNISFNPVLNSEVGISSSSIRDIPCTLQNCDLNTSCSLIRSSSSLSSGGGIVGVSGCYSAPSTMKMNQQNQTSNQNLAQILATNQSTQNLYEQYMDCMGAVSQTILPPPLFDTSSTPDSYNQCYEFQSNPENYCAMSAMDMPKLSSSSKRLHRTIPKHFTSSPSASAIFAGELNQQHQGSGRSSEIKKPSCQCPVQHVPMSYMQFQPPQLGQSPMQQPMQELQQIHQHFTQPQRHQHSIYLSGNKKHNVIKSTTFPSAINASSGQKIQTIANVELMRIGEEKMQPTTTAEMSRTIISSGGSGTMRRSHKSSNNCSLAATTPKKSIATISNATSVQQLPVASTLTFFTPKLDVKHQPNLPQQQAQQIHSILKNKSHSDCQAADGSCEQNPILPPKMYKASSNKYSSTTTTPGQPIPGSSKQAHLITRPNELTTSSSQFSLLSAGSSQKYQQQYQHQQPMQLRTNIQVKRSTDETCYEDFNYFAST